MYRLQSVIIICLRITDKFSINLCRLPLLVGQHSIPFISATTVKARATSRIRIPIPLSPPSHNKTHTVCIDLLAACPRKSLIARPTSHTKSSARSLCRHPVAAPTSLNLVLTHSLTSDKQRSQHRRRIRILRASIHPSIQMRRRRRTVTGLEDVYAEETTTTERTNKTTSVSRSRQAAALQISNGGSNSHCGEHNIKRAYYRNAWLLLSVSRRRRVSWM